MQTLRISASDLDAWRRFKDSEDASLPDLLAQLRRELPPTPAMQAGTALHTALETASEGAFDELVADGHRFTVAADAEIALPDIREMKVTATRRIGDVLVTLVGKVDGVSGRKVIDHKLTSRFDAERFLNSYQWRVYLDVFEADEFEWIIYEATEDRDDPTHRTIREVHHLRAHRYPGMSADIDCELAAFVDFAKVHLIAVVAA